MIKRRRTLIALTAILVTSTFLLIKNHAVACSISENNYENCTFCDGDELTMREKCEELIWKALTDEKNLLDEGIVSEEIYTIQCAPFEEALDELETATDEEVEERYKWILIYFFDELAEYEADGEEVDEEFLYYIRKEIETLETKVRKFYNVDKKDIAK